MPADRKGPRCGGLEIFPDNKRKSKRKLLKNDLLFYPFSQSRYRK